MKTWLATHIERRPEPSGILVITVSLLAIGLAFLVAGLLVWGYGIPPSEFYKAIWQGHFSGLRGFAEIGRQAIPLLLAGLGLVIAFRAQFWTELKASFLPVRQVHPGWRCLSRYPARCCYR